MLKRLLYSLTALSALFLLMLNAQFVSASSGFSVKVEQTNTPVRGEDFTVNIDVSGNPGFVEFNVQLNYDSESMTLTDAEFSDFLKDNPQISCSRNQNTLKITADSPITRNGTLVKLKFRLASDVTLGSYPIRITSEGNGIRGTDGKLSPQLIAGGVELECYHNYFAVETTEPTCSSEGFTVYRCRECSTSYITDYVAKKAHTWQNVSEEKATCTRPGQLTHTCKVCGETETIETSPMLGHDFEKKAVVEPTCSKEGYTLYSCTRCDESYHDEILPTVDHRYTKTYSKQASCAQTGYDLYACVFCGITYQVTVPTSEHQWDVQPVQATHDHGGWSLYTCTVCGLSMRGDFTDPLPYSYEYTVEQAATCTQSGVRIGTCTDGCGHTVREEIPPTGHHFGEWEKVRSATLYRSGLWSAVCADCGFILESSTPKLVGTSPSDPDVELFSWEFWKGILNRMAQNLAAVIVVCVAILILFLLILIPGIRRAVRRKRDPSVVRLETLAKEMQEMPPVEGSAPENIGDEFCHDYKDFGLPDSSVIAQVHLILDQAQKPKP